ncbi:MAG: amino acid permease, partial [Candidatus Binataceae bacterium]
FATALAAQSVAQLGALFALRRRGIRSPYRMWLFPLPALIAIAGWCYAFASAGAPAIAYGLLAIASAILAYLWRAHRARDWPFAFAQPLTR